MLTFGTFQFAGVCTERSRANWEQKADLNAVFGVVGAAKIYGERTTRDLSFEFHFGINPQSTVGYFSTVAALEQHLSNADVLTGLEQTLSYPSLSLSWPNCSFLGVNTNGSPMYDPYWKWHVRATLRWQQLKP